MSSFTEPLEYKEVGQGLYVITKSFTYKIGSLEHPVGEVIIPENFVTDLTSVPWPFSYFFPPDGPYAQAAVLHDYMIDLPISKSITDSVFYEAMTVLNINRLVATIFFIAVRIRSFFRK